MERGHGGLADLLEGGDGGLPHGAADVVQDLPQLHHAHAAVGALRHLGDVLEEDCVEAAEVSAQVGLLGRRRGEQLRDPARARVVVRLALLIHKLIEA